MWAAKHKQNLQAAGCDPSANNGPRSAYCAGALAYLRISDFNGDALCRGSRSPWSLRANPALASPERSRDGSKIPTGPSVFWLGYYNRNRNQELDIPIGPNNRIEPGGPTAASLPTSSLAGLGACSR